MEITINDIPVIYVVSPNGPQGAEAAFKKLEDAINWELKGRRFYGAMVGNEYRACLAIKDPEETSMLSFPTWTIPGGKYAKAKIKDWAQHIPDIGKEFDRLRKEYNWDESRPAIEYYESMKELNIFLPIQ